MEAEDAEVEPEDVAVERIADGLREGKTCIRVWDMSTRILAAGAAGTHLDRVDRENNGMFRYTSLNYQPLVWCNIVPIAMIK